MKCISCSKFKGILKKVPNMDQPSWNCNEKIITADSEICEDFIIHPIIFCHRKGKVRQINIDVCLHYQKENKCKCKRGIEIKNYTDKRLVKLTKRIRR
jgi:hypothetical protein